MSNRGLNVELALAPLTGEQSGTIFIAVLDCDLRQDESSSHALTPAIILQRTSWHNDTEFVRIRTDYLFMLSMNRIILPEHGGFTRMGHTRLSEARPRQIFVPHRLSARRSPRGILFHPEVTRTSLHDPVDVNVLSQPSDWLFYDERRPNERMAKAHAAGQSTRESSPGEELPYVRTKSYVLNFDHSSDLGVTEPTKPTILGSLELEIKKDNGWNTWEVCLLVGLEPLPANPFGTPSLYTVPWYAFAPKAKVAAGELDDELRKDKRQEGHKLNTLMLSVEFDLESRYSRLFYNAVLKLAKADKKG